jgi:uncharacterized membrane protein
MRKRISPPGGLTFAGLALALPLGAAPAKAFFGLGSKHAAVRPQGDAVRIPLAEINDGAAHFYELSDGGKGIRFFVVQSRDGVVRAAFDACDVCYHSRKGYTQDGAQMVCVNCSQRFDVARVNEVKGGCNPAPLERRVDGDTLSIPLAALRAGANFF